MAVRCLIKADRDCLLPDLPPLVTRRFSQFARLDFWCCFCSYLPIFLTSVHGGPLLQCLAYLVAGMSVYLQLMSVYF